MRPTTPLRRRDVYHAVCRHQVEVAVWPASAEIYFRDERWTDPINTQLRFEAVVYNSRLGAIWSVVSPSGGPGAGTISQTGEYQAPDKGALLSGSTDIVVATAREDPLRKAYAWVTLCGLGPLPHPEPAVAVWPHRATLYYWTGDDNAYMDASNKLQVFRAVPRHPTNAVVTWSVTAGMGTVVPSAADSRWCTYLAPNSGPSANSGGAPIATVTAALAADPSVTDAAAVVLLNYQWPNF